MQLFLDKVPEVLSWEIFWKQNLVQFWFKIVNYWPYKAVEYTSPSLTQSILQPPNLYKLKNMAHSCYMAERNGAKL